MQVEEIIYTHNITTEIRIGGGGGGGGKQSPVLSLESHSQEIIKEN